MGQTNVRCDSQRDQVCTLLLVLVSDSLVEFLQRCHFLFVDQPEFADKQEEMPVIGVQVGCRARRPAISRAFCSNINVVTSPSIPNAQIWSKCS